MRRREVLAGVASAGTLAGAGALAVYGLPGDDDEEPRHDPVTIDTVDATGSSEGTTISLIAARVSMSTARP